jgi:hypothetical protein
MLAIPLAEFIGELAMQEATRRQRPRIIERLELRFALDAPEFGDGEVMGHVDIPDIDAASGLVASRRNKDVLWLQNDLGDSRIFAVNSHGDYLGVFETGVSAVDWEDIAIGPGPAAGMHYLYIADTGDNSESRTEVAVIRVAEPDVAADQSPVEETLAGVATLRFRYPDGSHDTETLIVDPESGNLYLVTKRDARSRIYRAESPQSTTSVTILEFVDELTWTAASAGDISPSGCELILKDLSRVYYYARPEGTSIGDALRSEPERLPYRSEPLGEGLTFDAQGSGYYTHSEGTNQPLYYYERISTSVSADLNGDGSVNRTDVRMLAAEFGRTGLTASAIADLNGDGNVDLKDLAVMQIQLSAVSVPQAALAQARSSQRSDAAPEQPTGDSIANEPASRVARRVVGRKFPTTAISFDAVDHEMSNWRFENVRRLRRT